MRSLKLGLVFVLLLVTPALAALNFPALTGRVVDDAHILSPGTIQSLDQTLAGYEQATTNQLVVVTVPSLQDVPIETYGYQLGRAWGIGQKGKNNGVLLIVAPKERKVRIEVGYGLEATFTDAICSQIIDGIILPDFRTGNMEQGIIDGVSAITGGESLAASTSKAQQPQNGVFYEILMLGIILLVMFISRVVVPFSSVRSGSSFASGSSSLTGGFSGGGGSFGGGGASGGW